MRDQDRAIATQDTALEIKCAVLSPYAYYLVELLGEDEAVKVIRETGLTLDYLKMESNWVSYSYTCRLLAKMVEVTGNDRAPYEAASRFTRLRTYGPLGYVLVRFGGTVRLYRLLVQFASLWNRISSWEIIDASDCGCSISVRYHVYKQDRHNCLAIQGSLAAVPCQLGQSLANVEEVQCACDGADRCVYRVTWKETSGTPRCGIGIGVGVSVGMAIGTLAGWNVTNIVGLFLWALTGYAIGREMDFREELNRVRERNEEQATELLKSISDADALNEELQSRVEQRTAELQKAYKDLQNAMTDLRASRERELQAEQQATMGIVAGGMAHELNSPLNAVRLSLQELAEDIPESSPMREALTRADRASYRCKRIINDLLICAREPRRDALLDLRTIVRDTVRLYHGENPDGIMITVKIEEGLPGLALDQIQMQHVVMNLLKNASDAMEAKGDVKVDLCREGDDVVLRVSDNGSGVSDEDKDHIFQPLYSTKGGRGLGLGLSITKQLVWGNGGAVSVSNGEGGGAVFAVRFPVSGQRGSNRKPGQAVQ